jgi:hypothetical protein
MTNRELQKYITEERAKGAGDVLIRAALVEAGWNVLDVDTALAEDLSAGKNKSTLIVIGVLCALLISVVLVFGAMAPSSSRESDDMQRVFEVDSIQLAAELYYGEHGAYPTTIDELATKIGSPEILNNSAYRYELKESGYRICASLETQDGEYCASNQGASGVSSDQTGSDKLSDDERWNIQGVSLLNDALYRYINVKDMCPATLEELRPYLSETFIRLGYPLGPPFEYMTTVDKNNCRVCVPLTSEDRFCDDRKKGGGRESELGTF